MRNFDLTALASQLATVAAELRLAETAAVDAAAALIEAEAKAIIGHYQGAAGPFEPWPLLSEATLYGGVAPSGFHYPGKVELGFAPPDNPELRTGTMRESIGRKVEGRSAVIGSDSEVLFWQEFGTRYMPPRPILGMAGAHKGEEAAKIIGETVARAIAGERLPPKAATGD